MDKMFQLLIVSLFFIVSTTNGLSLPPGNLDSVESTNSSLDKIEETLGVFEKMSNDKNFTESNPVNVNDSVSSEEDKEKKTGDELAPEPSVNSKENTNSTSTTTTETASPSSASTPAPTTSSTSAPSSVTTPSTSITRPSTTSSTITSSEPTHNDTPLETAFDSNGTMVNEIMSSMDSILHELNTNSSETANNDLSNSLSPSGEFNNYFEELRVLDGLTALFESD